MSAFAEACRRGIQGMEGISTGTCPGCETCMDIDGYDDAAEHRTAWSTKDLPSGQASFSWRACGICGTTLAGARTAWHWVDPNDPAHGCNHESDACDDCVAYLDTGNEPDIWHRSPYSPDVSSNSR